MAGLALSSASFKLVPTFSEKLVWAPGDARGLRVVETTVGRVGMLICGENTNPLARYALMAQGEQVHISIVSVVIQDPPILANQKVRIPQAARLATVPSVNPMDTMTPQRFASILSLVNSGPSKRAAWAESALKKIVRWNGVCNAPHMGNPGMQDSGKATRRRCAASATISQAFSTVFWIRAQTSIDCHRFRRFLLR
jgi:hypothetical protein